MNKKQAKQEIINRAKEYFAVAKKKDTYICPLCNNGSGKDGDGIVTRDGIHYKCFKCGFYGDVINYIGAEKNLDPTSTFEEACKIFGITVEGATSHVKPRELQSDNLPAEATKTSLYDENEGDMTQAAANYAKYFLQARKALQESPEALTYLQERGISQKTAEKLYLGYDSNWKSPKALSEDKNPPASPRIIIPTNETAYTARDIRPEVDKAYKTMKQGNSNIFNFKALYNESEQPVFITEGEFDALSVIEVGAQAVALGSTGNKEKLVILLKENKITNPLIICLDNDEAGQKATTELTAEIDHLNIFYTVQNISGEYKDPNEHLQTDPQNFYNAIQTATIYAIEAVEIEKQAQAEKAQKEAEIYRDKTSVTAHIQDFLDEIKQSTNTPATLTGFKKLDHLLDDGLYSGLYIVGAISSLGKTTFVLQIADQIAQSEQDVLIFSLEMAKTELMAKSISRTTVLECNGNINNAKTTRDIMAGKKYIHYSQIEKELINKAIELYSTYTDHLFIYEGTGNIGTTQIREAVETHIKLTGNKPVVIVDYLQILAPCDTRSTDKQNTDKAVFELKRLSRDYNIPVIAISSLNRENYTNIISLKAFKESGAIEYSSDVLIGLQFEKIGDNEGVKDENINQWKRQDPRKIELKILKNRNGQTGDSIMYNYFSKFNYFMETGIRQEKK